MWLNQFTVALRPLWARYWRFRVEGESQVPRSGPLVIAANHSSFLDPWFLSILFPRPLHHLVNRRWYERSRLWKAFFDANGTVPLEDNMERSFEVIAEMLARDRVVSIFPEGRISDDGSIHRFRSGVSWVAAKYGVPVLPVGVRGSYESIPRGQRFPRRGPISLHIGEPMRFLGSPRADASMREVRQFRDALYDEICDLCGQPERKRRRRGTNPDEPAGRPAAPSATRTQ